MDFNFTKLNEAKRQKFGEEFETLINKLYLEHKQLELTDPQQFINTLAQLITNSFDTPEQDHKFIVTVTATQCEPSTASTTLDFTMATLWNNAKDDVYTKALRSENLENKIYVINAFVIAKSD